jgi:hypothetical protein
LLLLNWASSGAERCFLEGVSVFLEEEVIFFLKKGTFFGYFYKGIK